MKNPTYLQKQYTKLTKKLNKAFATGRFYEYTQYKQQQLLDKFASYTLQMKKLGMVAAVGAAVAMATPAMGQVRIPFINLSGSTNPIDTFKSDFNTFVDLDNDGDLDVVGTELLRSYVGYSNSNYYYENIGTATNPNFIERTPIFSDTLLHWVKFVDIDADGDLDCFGSRSVYDGNNYYGEAVQYYENIGSPTNYNFVARSGVLNPLDSVNTHSLKYVLTSVVFGDLDADGDLDCIYDGPGANYTGDRIFYRNNGTATNPVFNRELNATLFTGGNPGKASGGGDLLDADNDGDLDFLSARGTSYFENTGTINAPVFVARTGNNNPFSNLGTDSIDTGIQLVDIDADGFLDVFGGHINLNSYKKAYFQSIVQSTILTNIYSEREESLLDLVIFPNPTTGIINLEESLTGSLEVFNTLGQVVYTEQLEEEQQLSLSHLGNGTYIVKVQTEEGVLQEKVVLQR